MNRSWHANTNSYASDEERFKKSLKLLCDSKLFVQVKIPLFANNVKNIFKILDSLKEFDIDEIVLIPIIPVGKAKNLPNLIGQRQAKQIIKLYGDPERNIKVFKWVKGKHFLIRSNGNVILHPPLRKEEDLLGNAMDRPIGELWERVPEKYKQINSDFTSDLSQLS